MKRFAFAALLLLAACADGVRSTELPEMTFANLRPVELNVSRIIVRNDYKAPLRAPNVEHLFKTPPASAAETLLNRQLSGMNPAGDVLYVVIEDASVTSEELPVDDSFVGYFKQEPVERLNAKLLVRFEIAHPTAPDIIVGQTNVVVKRTKTLLEGTSPADRNRAYFDMTERMMDDLNDGVRTAVKGAFGFRQ